MDKVQDIIKMANQIAKDIKNGNSGVGSTIFITQDHPQYNELKKIIEKKSKTIALNTEEKLFKIARKNANIVKVGKIKNNE